jgi:hypothetical protein
MLTSSAAAVTVVARWVFDALESMIVKLLQETIHFHIIQLNKKRKRREKSVWFLFEMCA